MSLDTLADLESYFWNSLINASKDRKHPFRTFVLCTITRSNQPDGRHVILRHVDKLQNTLSIYTDARTPKVEQLVSSPEGALVFYDNTKQIQFRANGYATIHHQDAISALKWSQIPKHARKDYLSTMHPGAILTDEPSFLEDSNGDNFCVLVFNIKKIDILILGKESHKRALINYEKERTIAEWLIP